MIVVASGGLQRFTPTNTTLTSVLIDWGKETRGGFRHRERG